MIEPLATDECASTRGRRRGPRGLLLALGSGFLINPDGEILTNNHIVAGADRIRVGLFGDDRKTYLATLVGRDPLTDSALIRLKDAPGNLPSATLGDSDALEPGDWVMPDADHLTAMVAATPAGSRVPLTFYRNGSRERTTATIEELELENNRDGTRRQ